MINLRWIAWCPTLRSSEFSTNLFFPNKTTIYRKIYVVLLLVTFSVENTDAVMMNFGSLWRIRRLVRPRRSFSLLPRPIAPHRFHHQVRLSRSRTRHRYHIRFGKRRMDDHTHGLIPVGESLPRLSLPGNVIAEGD